VNGSFHSVHIRRAASPIGPSVEMWIASGSNRRRMSCSASYTPIASLISG
jgi:hypothetical protein